jgi:hypothetical protein
VKHPAEEIRRLGIQGSPTAVCHRSGRHGPTWGNMRAVDPDNALRQVSLAFEPISTKEDVGLTHVVGRFPRWPGIIPPIAGGSSEYTASLSSGAQNLTLHLMNGNT